MKNTDYPFLKRILEDISVCLNSPTNCHEQYDDLTKCISEIEAKESERKSNKAFRWMMLYGIMFALFVSACVIEACFCVRDKEYIISFLLFASALLDLGFYLPLADKINKKIMGK